MTKLTETQAIVLSAGAQRPGNIAMPGGFDQVDLVGW